MRLLYYLYRKLRLYFFPTPIERWIKESNHSVNKKELPPLNPIDLIEHVNYTMTYKEEEK